MNLEGMIIAGYAVGARNGYIYVRAEYPLAVHRVEVAIKQAKKKGLLGRNILHSDYSFDIKVFQGSGAFVCGEETALLESQVSLTARTAAEERGPVTGSFLVSRTPAGSPYRCSGHRPSPIWSPGHG